MTRILNKPVSQTYEVDDFTVQFFQLTEGDYIELASLEGKRDVVYESGEWTGFREEVNRRRSERLLVYRSLGDTSLEWDDGKSVFTTKDGRVKSGMTENAFNNAWKSLPRDVADKIVEKFYEHNPTLKAGE